MSSHWHWRWPARAAPPGGRAGGRGRGLLCATLGVLERTPALLGGAVVVGALDAGADELGVDVVLLGM